MKISRKPRHWFALAFALATTVVAGMALADFSGDPAPRWREVFLHVGPPLMILTIICNRVLDRRGSGEAS